MQSGSWSSLPKRPPCSHESGPLLRSFVAGESVATFTSAEPPDLEVRAQADIVEENLRHSSSKRK